jgi:ribosomal protein S18 acetylase RimI-like enzyme
MMTDRRFENAGTRDQPSVVNTLALAFQDDPALCWIIPDAERRRARLPILFELLFESDLPKGMILKSPAHESCSLWRAPGTADTGPLELLRSAIPMLRVFGAGIGRGIAVSNALDAHHPKAFPYWYLHFVGVQPDFQGKGWGGAIIRDGLARTATYGLPTYLETATPQNVPLYLRLGFEIAEEWNVPGGGPHFWSMIRPPWVSDFH